MTMVLIVDPDKDMRLAMEVQLSESNQFDQVCSCADLQSAQSVLFNKQIKVILLDAGLAGTQSSLLQRIKASNPELGIVLIQGPGGGLIDSSTLYALGGYAQISRLSASMEIVASIAKALVAASMPGKQIK